MRPSRARSATVLAECRWFLALFVSRDESLSSEAEFEGIAVGLKYAIRRDVRGGKNVSGSGLLIAAVSGNHADARLLRPPAEVDLAIAIQ